MSVKLFFGEVNNKMLFQVGCVLDVLHASVCIFVYSLDE